MLELKVVLDTNVFISALFIFKGNPAKIIDFWMEDKYSLILSEFIVEEIIKVLYKKGLQVLKIEELLSLMSQKSLMVNPKEKISAVKDDPSDNKFLECAISGKADYIVSGDRHLLNLKEYKGIKILTPKEFLEEIERLSIA
ncbi:MAG: putative toxin-antitoxin system toxin component, PIN family [bacterium]|nr:putative toxin-antitoxin system toxin component, PIN family [bacterium]